MGYGQFNCHGKIYPAHRLAYAIHHGHLPEDTCVLHSCDTPRCIKPAHLFPGDHLINNRDMFRKGRGHVFDGTHILGTDNHNAKLDEYKVTEAIWLRSQGLGLEEIGKRYGVSATVIHCILDRKTWQHAVTVIDNGWMTAPELAETQAWWQPYEVINGSRGKSGAENGNSKLTDAAVMEIIWLRSQGISTADLAKRYGISKTLAKNVLAGRTWRHISDRLIPTASFCAGGGPVA